MFYINFPRLLISITITAGLLLVASPLVSPPTSPAPTPTVIPHPTAQLSVIVDGQSQQFIFPITATSSALSLLQMATSRDNIPLVTKTDSSGFITITSLSGLPATSTRIWQLFINGQSSSLNPNRYLVLPGDKIDWKYLTVSP